MVLIDHAPFFLFDGPDHHRPPARVRDKSAFVTSVDEDPTSCSPSILSSVSLRLSTSSSTCVSSPFHAPRSVLGVHGHVRTASRTPRDSSITSPSFTGASCRASPRSFHGLSAVSLRSSWTVRGPYGLREFHGLLEDVQGRGIGGVVRSCFATTLGGTVSRSTVCKAIAASTCRAIGRHEKVVDGRKRKVATPTDGRKRVRPSFGTVELRHGRGALRHERFERGIHVR